MTRFVTSKHGIVSVALGICLVAIGIVLGICYRSPLVLVICLAGGTFLGTWGYATDKD